MEEMKPCPFCNGEARLVESKLYYGIFSVMCTQCPAKITAGHDEYGLTKQGAINFWNTRWEENNGSNS